MRWSKRSWCCCKRKRRQNPRSLERAIDKELSI
jgi:hypothetical protein